MSLLIILSSVGSVYQLIQHVVLLVQNQKYSRCGCSLLEYFCSSDLCVLFLVLSEHLNREYSMGIFEFRNDHYGPNYNVLWYI